MELRSISEEERVKSGLTRAKLGGLSKAEIMEMVNILNIFVNVLINIAFLIILIILTKRAKLEELSEAEIMEIVYIVIHIVAKESKIIQSTKSRRQLKWL